MFRVTKITHKSIPFYIHAATIPIPTSPLLSSKPKSQNRSLIIPPTQAQPSTIVLSLQRRRRRPLPADLEQQEYFDPQESTRKMGE
ncbi:hypothetical protein ACS0TY_025186 [Phlomoides rotata]